MKVLPFFFMAILAACTKPYIPPQLEHPVDHSLSDEEAAEPIEFKGVKQLLSESPAGSIQMIFSHGMCSHLYDTQWAIDRALLLANALDVPMPIVGDGPTYFGPDDKPVVRTSSASFEVGELRIDATFLRWGEGVDRYRDELSYENFRRGERGDLKRYQSPTRALGNDLLRSELMNKCLIDAVVYLGRNGDVIRSAMRAAACEAIGGALTDEDERPSGVPGEQVLCTRNSDRARNDPIVLAPESLGSIILTDAFAALVGGLDGYPEERMVKLSSVFLLSNQIPLLNQGNVGLGQRTVAKADGSTATVTEPALVNSLALLLQQKIFATRSDTSAGGGDDGSDRKKDRTQVIAFTDPNDILSYRVKNKHLAAGSDDVHVVNVLISNAYTYLELFANPISTHTETAGENAFEIVVHGSAALE